MQLTRFTDYGFRLLTYLALLPAGQRTSIDQISALYQLSPNTVNKLVHQLGKAGVIETRQGKGGGFYLKMAPEDISLREIVLLLEKTVQLTDCHSPACRIQPSCRLQAIYREAANAFLDHLNDYTLADLLSNREALSEQLNLAP